MFRIIMPILLIALTFSMCNESPNKVVFSLGKNISKDYYSNGGFQDYTDYAKYTFENPELQNNRYFEKITDESLEDFRLHIENFESRIDCTAEYDKNHELVLNYDFNMDVVSSQDYLYIDDDPDYPELGCYDVYFYDVETNVLYYFHSNT